MNSLLPKGFLQILVFAISLGVSSCLAAKSPLDAFPLPGEGEVRHVISLEDKGYDEVDSYKVELIPGKLVKTDGVNSVRISLGLEPVNLKGWGYTYYRLTGKGEVLSTMMAVPEGTEPQEEFVAGTPLMVRYNSRLPLVIYTPQGVDIHYRIWAAGEEFVADKDM